MRSGSALTELLSYTILATILGLPFAIFLNILYIGEVIVFITCILGIIFFIVYGIGMKYLYRKSMLRGKKLSFSIIWIGLLGVAIGIWINQLELTLAIYQLALVLAVLSYIILPIVGFLLKVFKPIYREPIARLDKSKYQKYLNEGFIHENLRIAIEKEGYKVKEDAKLKKVKKRVANYRKGGGWWIVYEDKKEYRLKIRGGKIDLITTPTISEHIDSKLGISLSFPSLIVGGTLWGLFYHSIFVGLLFITFYVLFFLFFGPGSINIPQELIGGLSGLAIGAIYGSILGIFRARVHSLIQRLEDLFEGLSQKKSGSMKSRGKKQPSSSVTDSHRCGRCGTKNPKKADFCKNCGEKLEGTEVW